MGAVVDSRSTQDVDVVAASIPRAVLKAARSVADSHQMPRNWVNDDVAGLVDADLPADAFQPLYTGRNLIVLGAKPEYLLGLKLMAGRSQDIADLVALADELGTLSADSMLAVCDEVFAESPSYPSERGFIETVCGDIAPVARKRRAGEGAEEGAAGPAAEGPCGYHAAMGGDPIRVAGWPVRRSAHRARPVRGRRLRRRVPAGRPVRDGADHDDLRRQMSACPSRS